MSQPKRSLFLNSKKKSCPWQCDRETPLPEIQGSSLSHFPPVTPQVAPVAVDIQLTAEGREKGGSLWGVSWASRGSGVYLLCSHSTDHYSSPRSQLRARKVQNIYAHGESSVNTCWVPEHIIFPVSRHLFHFSLHKINIQPYIVLGKQLLIQ